MIEPSPCSEYKPELLMHMDHMLELMEAEKIILTLGESLGYVYGTVALRVYL